MFACPRSRRAYSIPFCRQIIVRRDGPVKGRDRRKLKWLRGRNQLVFDQTTRSLALAPPGDGRYFSSVAPAARCPVSPTTGGGDCNVLLQVTRPTPRSTTPSGSGGHRVEDQQACVNCVVLLNGEILT